MLNITNKVVVGWNEWCVLPKLKVPAIKAKIDTGAKTSSLHAFNIKSLHKNGVLYVSYDIHPLQGKTDVTRKCVSKVVDQRSVMSSNGHKELRYVISTPLILGDQEWDILLTLSNRDPLRFRMLLGREALSNRVIIEPWRELCQGRLKKQKISKLYHMVE